MVRLKQCQIDMPSYQTDLNSRRTLRTAPCCLGPSLSHRKAFRWSTRLRAMANGIKCRLTAKQWGEGRKKSINIIFGDVWFCSGQSNMIMPMARILNWSGEMENSKAYRNIFMLNVPSPNRTQKVL